MNDQSKKVIIGLKKAKSLLEKIVTMIEKDSYCIDVIQQNLAVIGLLKAANATMLEGHVNCCIKSACIKNNKKEIEDKMAELIKVLKIAQSK